MFKRGERLLFAPERKRRPARWVVPLLIVFIFAAVLGLNAINNGRARLIKQSVSISLLPTNLEGYKILHVSDLHAARFGEKQSRLKTLLESASYNAVCVTGDIVGKSGDIEPFLDFLALVPKNVPVYFIAGDDDPAPVPLTAHGSGEAKAEYIRRAEAAGAIYLDAPQKLLIGKATLWFYPESLVGLDIKQARDAVRARITELTALAALTPDESAALRAAQYYLNVYEAALAAQTEAKNTDTRIVLSHAPLSDETIRSLQAWTGDESVFVKDISLILAGHVCAGQWRIPGYGAFYSALTGWKPAQDAVSGLRVVQGVSQYVSPGLGASEAYHFMPGRLFNTPSMTMITLTGTLQ